MIAKQSLFLTADNKVVVEGDAEARFLLVREGHDINEAMVEKYDCADLVGTAAKVKPKAAEPNPLESMPERTASKKVGKKKK